MVLIESHSREHHVDFISLQLVPLEFRLVLCDIIIDVNYQLISTNISVADLRGGAPPTAQHFLIFMQFFGIFLQNRRLAPPPTVNPGSTPAFSDMMMLFGGNICFFQGSKVTFYAQ